MQSAKPDLNRDETIAASVSLEAVRNVVQPATVQRSARSVRLRAVEAVESMQSVDLEFAAPMTRCEKMRLPPLERVLMRP